MFVCDQTYHRHVYEDKKGPTITGFHPFVVNQRVVLPPMSGCQMYLYNTHISYYIIYNASVVNLNHKVNDWIIG